MEPSASAGAFSSLEPITQQAIRKLDSDELLLFTSTYGRKKRGVGGMVALAVLFPIQLFLLGKVALGVAFVLTWGGLGVWWIVEWFLTPTRVREYNNMVAMGIVQEISLMRNL